MRFLIRNLRYKIILAVPWLIVSFFNTLPFPAHGSGREDSLYKILVKTTDLGKKVQIYLSLAELVKTRFPDSCIHLLDEARKNFRQINSFPYLGKVYEMRGDISHLGYNFEEATRQYKIAVFCYGKQGKKEADKIAEPDWQHVCPK